MDNEQTAVNEADDNGFFRVYYFATQADEWYGNPTFWTNYARRRDADDVVRGMVGQGMAVKAWYDEIK